jgi:O-acetyl-ADP-ribose deacetylase (regulator of RNase III)
MLKGIVGDALQPQAAPPLIIAHVLSSGGAYEAGFAAQVARRWPQLPQRYREWVLATLPGFDAGRLGAVQFVGVEPGITVAHLTAMRGLRSKRNPVPLDYAALTDCLLRLDERAHETGESIHMPLIGTGYVGGDWQRIKGILRSIFASTPYPLFVYRLPEER